jgi:hypothetical protein
LSSTRVIFRFTGDTLHIIFVFRVRQFVGTNL